MTFATQSDFDAAISGRWFLCGVPSMFGTSNEIGLEITADQRWRKLCGSLEAPKSCTGWGIAGSWESLDESYMNGPGSFQLNLMLDGGGTFTTTLKISSNGSHMRIDNQGVVAEYVRL
jgi:hypothetical protein